MRNARRSIRSVCISGLLCVASVVGCAQTSEVSVDVVLQLNGPVASAKGNQSLRPADVVIWLTPATPDAAARADLSTHEHFRLVQRDKEFTPHLLVVPVGSNVEFPNRDPFFHNVFSLFNGKRFDLGMYESGTTRTVRFDREGVSYIFCNIHPEMGAVVLALTTPYYAVTGSSGSAVIRGVPPGEYRLSVWSETAEPVDSAIAEHVVRVAGEAIHLGPIKLRTSNDPMRHHKNKFGEEYLPARNRSY